MFDNLWNLSKVLVASNDILYFVIDRFVGLFWNHSPGDERFFVDFNCDEFMSVSVLVRYFVTSAFMLKSKSWPICSFKNSFCLSKNCGPGFFAWILPIAGYIFAEAKMFTQVFFNT